MPRLREIPRGEVTDPKVLALYDQLFGDRDPVAQPGTATGTRGDWWTVFANSPDVLIHAARGFGLYRDPARKIDPVLRELAQTRAGWTRGSQFVFSQHCKSLRGLGVSEARIAAVPAWQVSDVFDARERAVLAYADALVLDGGRVADGVFEALKGFLDDQQDSGTDLHHLPLRDARGDEPGPAPGVRRPSRTDRRGRRAGGFRGAGLHGYGAVGLYEAYPLSALPGERRGPDSSGEFGDDAPKALAQTCEARGSIWAPAFAGERNWGVFEKALAMKVNALANTVTPG